MMLADQACQKSPIRKNVREGAYSPDTIGDRATSDFGEDTRGIGTLLQYGSYFTSGSPFLPSNNRVTSFSHYCIHIVRIPETSPLSLLHSDPAQCPSLGCVMKIGPKKYSLTATWVPTTPRIPAWHWSLQPLPLRTAPLLRTAAVCSQHFLSGSTATVA